MTAAMVKLTSTDPRAEIGQPRIIGNQAVVQVVLKTASVQQVKVEGAEAPITVRPGPLDHFKVEGAHGGMVGDPLSYDITAMDASGNHLLSYSPVNMAKLITTTDPDATFTWRNPTFTQGKNQALIKFFTAGLHIITVRDGQAVGRLAVVDVHRPKPVEPLAVAIQSPTSAATYETDETSIDLVGTASGQPVSVTYAAPLASGSAQGTSPWTITGLRLKPGQNLIKVVATDRQGGTASTTLTVNRLPGTVAPLDLDKVVVDPDTDLPVVGDEILITFRPTLSRDQVDAKVRAIGGKIIGHLAEMNDYQVRIGGSPTLPQLKALLEQLLQDPDVEASALNQLSDTETVPQYPNDPTWFAPICCPPELVFDSWNEEKPAGRNWGLEMINAPTAWNYYTDPSLGGMSHVRVGVLDAGFLPNHEDLPIAAEDLFQTGDWWMPDHGTHVAGTIAATPNNNKGVTGIVWDASICAIKADGTAFGAKFDILWLLYHDCKLINVSMGARKPKVLDEHIWEISDRYWSAFFRQVNATGFDYLIVQGAGNEAIDSRYSGFIDSVSDPELRKRMISVSALSIWDPPIGAPRFGFAGYSNYGPLVDVIAPGTDVFSTSSACASLTYIGTWGKKCVPNLDTTDKYESMTGTSMATPHATGVAALVWAANPSLSGSQVKEIVVSSADRWVNSRGTSYPLVNAAEAVRLAKSTTGDQPVPPTPSGTILGQVHDFKTGAPIEDAYIWALPAPSYGTDEGWAFTDHQGIYQLTLKPGRYKLIIQKIGYVPAEAYVDVRDGLTVHYATLRLPEESDRSGVVTGTIRNVLDGRSVPGLQVDFMAGVNAQYDENSTVIASTTTDSRGAYSVELPAGVYTGRMSGPGYITGFFTLISVGGETNPGQDGVVTPELSSGETRIVLTWGSAPRDLDAHLTGPAMDGGRFHVSFADRAYSSGDTLYAGLDHDDVNSYGPETVTVYRQVDGVYRYTVHDYTNRGSSSSTALSASGARVQVYRGSALVADFNVPVDQGGTAWTVFEMSGDTITPINRLTYESNPGLIQGGGPPSDSTRYDINLITGLPNKSPRGSK